MLKKRVKKKNAPGEKAISEEEAQKKIVETVRPLPVRKLPISKSLGCFAGEDHFARLPLPAFDNSAMDGYAIVASSCKKGQRLRVIGEQPAGVDRRLRISRGEAIRIFTGAPVPAGAHAVVMQEDVTRDGEEIVLNVDVDHGDFIRRSACDLAEGQMILAKGEQIRAATTALLGSQGFAEVTVGGEVNAAIISTGDELVKQGEKIEQGQIYDSNSVLLDALVRRCGAIVDFVEHCGDERESLFEAVKRAASEGKDLRTAYRDAYAVLKPKYGEWVIFDHCLPFDVTRACDEATQYRDPRIWTAQREKEMWEALED